MPEITRFEGIIIQMFYNDHAPPHFHVDYGGLKACFDIKDCVFSKGALPARQSRLVLA